MVMCPKADAAATQKPAMDPAMMELMRNMQPQTFVQEIEHHAASGTSAEPDSTPVPMLMKMTGELDVDAAWQRVCDGAAADGAAWGRQVFLDELVDADGAAGAGGRGS